MACLGLPLICALLGQGLLQQGPTGTASFTDCNPAPTSFTTSNTITVVTTTTTQWYYGVLGTTTARAVITTPDLTTTYYYRTSLCGTALPACSGVTGTATVVRNVTQTVTLTSTVSVATKGTVIVSPTVTVTPSSVATVYDPIFVAPDDSCPLVTATASSGFVSNYTRYYSGCGRTEAFGNPGDHAPGAVKVLTGSGDSLPCKEIQLCAQAARDNQGGGSLSFDVHYLYSSRTWECRMWSGPNTDAAYFSDVNDDVRDVYGYSYVDSIGVDT